MCLPAPRRSHRPPSASSQKPPASLSSASSGSSAGSDPLPSPRRRRRHKGITTSTSSDLPAVRIATNPAQPSPLRHTAHTPTRRPSTKRSSKPGSVAGSVGGSIAGSLPPSRRPSTRGGGGRDGTKLAPASPQAGSGGGGRSPAMSTQSAKPSPSPTKKQTTPHKSRKYLETSSSQSTPLPSPRTRTTSEKRDKERGKGDMEARHGDRVIAARLPLEGGGSVSGLMVIRPGSSRRGSDNGSYKSKSSKSSEGGDAQTKKLGVKAAAAPPSPIGLGITMESLAPPKVIAGTRDYESQTRPVHVPVPRISVNAPPPAAAQQVPKSQVAAAPPPPPPPPVLVRPAPPPAMAPAPPAPPAPPAGAQKYPVMATLSYPTVDQLAYKPIERSQIPTVKKTPAPVPALAPAPTSAPPKPEAPATAAAVTPPPSRPLPSAAEKPAPPARPVSAASSISSSTTTTSSSLSASTTSEQRTPRQITYVPHPVSSPSSSSSSLVSVSSSASTSTTTSAYRRYVPSPGPVAPEMSSRKPNYYRYTPKKDTTQKRIMDSPFVDQDEDLTPNRKPAGPWDGMPGADPNLGAYYRNAAAEKRKNSKPGSSGDSGIDEANLANYYKQAEAQKRKLALERMKREDYEDTESTASSEVSDKWVDPNVAAYYRHAEAEKKKGRQQLTPQKQPASAPNPGDEKALRVYGAPPSDALGKPSPKFFRLRHVRAGLKVHPVPPPAPTPPPGTNTPDTETLGDTPKEKKAGPPEGAAESWFKTTMAGKGETASSYWNESRSTIESPAEDEKEEELKAGLPPAPTPPLSREDTPASSSSYYPVRQGYEREYHR